MLNDRESHKQLTEWGAIVRASPADLDKVHKILDLATEWLSSQGMNHWKGVHTRERILADFEKSHVFLALDLNGEAIGTVTISFETPWYHQPSDKNFWTNPEAFSAYVRKLAVVPNMMKRGIAARLLKAAEQDAMESQALFARLDTNPAFPGLVPYYKGHGYVVVGTRDGNSFFEKRLAYSAIDKSSA